MATVARTWHSAPRRPGATLLVGPDGSAVGSVSGGCVEAAVYELPGRADPGGDRGQHRRRDRGGDPRRWRRPAVPPVGPHPRGRARLGSGS
ncbi:XdhC family protein [Micromonospora sp. A3M-1-15]|nr:XdhC family protein [Micromonospora sp. A3M-1-15]